MPSLATVISLTYCSGVAKPGTTALFRPSMPIEMAPLRLTFAFSSSSTRSCGLASLALTAAIGPAVPPPMTSTSTTCSCCSSVASDCLSISGSRGSCARAGMTRQAQGVLERVAAHVQVFEIERHAVGRPRQALDAQQGHTRRDRQRGRQFGIGADGADLHVGMAERDAVVAFQDQEDVAPGQVLAAQALAYLGRQVGHLERHGRAVEVAYAPDLADLGARVETQPLGHLGLGWHQHVADDAVDDAVAAPRHRFAEAFQPRQFLAGPGARDKSALAGYLDDQTFVAQVVQRLAHGDAADGEDRADLAFGRQARRRGVGAVIDAFAQALAHLGVQRYCRVFEGAECGHVVSWYVLS